MLLSGSKFEVKLFTGLVESQIFEKIGLNDLRKKQSVMNQFLTGTIQLLYIAPVSEIIPASDNKHLMV